MAVTIRVFHRWTVRAEGGRWTMLVGPSEVAVALNQLRGLDLNPDVDSQCVNEARRLYPQLEVLPSWDGPLRIH